MASRLIVDRVAACYDASLRDHARGRLLDLGCGNVPLFAAYKNYVTEAVCVDWANTLHRSIHLDAECDLTTRLPFQDGEFDTIILSDVLEHIAEPERLWAEMTRLLAPGGKILMNVPFFYWLHESPNDYYRYTEFALRRFVERAGLALITLQHLGGAPEIMADVFAKSALRVPRMGHVMAAGAQWAVAALVKAGLGRRMSESTQDSFPLGYFMIAGRPQRATES